MCGIGAIVSLKPFYLKTLISIPLAQLHRGTRGTGIAWSDGSMIYLLKSPIHPSLFAKKYDGFLTHIKTRIAIIHHRLPSRGSVCYNNTHPFMSCPKSPVRFAFCHNGTWVEADMFRDELISLGHDIQGTTDSEVIMHLIEEKIRDNLLLEEVMEMLNEEELGVLVIITRDSVYACGGGHRSLYMGRTKDAIILASTTDAIKSCAKNMKRNINKFYEVKFCKITLEDNRILIKGRFTPVRIKKYVYRWWS